MLENLIYALILSDAPDMKKAFDLAKPLQGIKSPETIGQQTMDELLEVFCAFSHDMIFNITHERYDNHSQNEMIWEALDDGYEKDILSALPDLLQKAQEQKIQKTKEYLEKLKTYAQDQLPLYEMAIEQVVFLKNRNRLIWDNLEKIVDRLKQVNPRSKKQLRRFQKDFCRKELGILPKFPGQSYKDFIINELFKIYSIDQELNALRLETILQTVK